MYAAVLENKGSIALRERDEPLCEDGGAVVRVEACGICRTDLKCYERGQRDLELPRILGHEIAGVVVATGAETKTPKVGSPVQVYPGLTCGDCRFCRQGRENMCEKLKIMGFNHDGGFADYITIPSRGVAGGILHEIPAGLSFAEATMAEPLACCVNAQETLLINSGTNVLIGGAGRLGILNARLAKHKGAENVIVLEPNKSRRRKASAYGIEHCLDPHSAHLKTAVMDITGGKGADTAINCCPNASALNTLFELLAKRGQLSYFSGLTDQQQVQPDFNQVHYKELTLRGSYGCSLNDNRVALKLLGSGAVKVEDLITRKISLDELEKGLSLVKGLSEISIVVTGTQGGLNGE